MVAVDSFCQLSAGEVDDALVLDARRAGTDAGEASEAIVESLRHLAVESQPSAEPTVQQLDAASGRIGLRCHST